MFNSLQQELEKLCHSGSIYDYFIFDCNGDNYKFRFFTKENEYFVKVECPNENSGGYIGATVLQRKPRAGEDHQRGNDLADGKYSLETWNHILRDIVSYEMVKVIQPEKKYDWSKDN